MSGTSLDGIDVAIVNIQGDTRLSAALVAHRTTPYPRATRARILAVSNLECTTRDISRLNFELAGLYAEAVQATCRTNRIPLRSLHLVGCHGQTIYHEGAGRTPNTLQIGESSVIAERLNLPVVSDFRTRDMAAGGQGAPLVPFVDYLLFRHPRRHRVALNIGGIANITILPANAKPEQVKAFDTGPGNMIVDQLVERMTSGKQRFDRNGAIAQHGHIQKPLLNTLLRDPYFAAAPPKSAGREQYGREFVDRLERTGLAPEDLIATATAFTAASIAAAVTRFAPQTKEVIASGGGVHNPQVMAQLAAFLPACQITTTADYAIDPDAKEAVAFAILAHRTWHGKPGNLPSATGASREVVLGKITPAGPARPALSGGRVMGE
jgi:anhydro-N-acetylmuramic acid kinase